MQPKEISTKNPFHASGLVRRAALDNEAEIGTIGSRLGPLTKYFVEWALFPP